MIKSMTGYGKAQLEHDAYEATAEIKTLNSKYLDVGLRLPRVFSDREIEVRSLLAEKIKRGKVSLAIEFTGSAGAQIEANINQEVFKAYYRVYKALKDELKDTSNDIFRLAALAPDVMQGSTQEAVDENIWAEVREVIIAALDRCDAFRQQEGAALEADLVACISNITLWLDKIKEQVPERNAKMRDRLRNQFAELEAEIMDKNRFEQELIYYIEKLDVNEEIVRLTNHLQYFVEILKDAESNGKKLGFVSQEIGREINTIGSKANDATIQRYVVGMKEELEKIKEQTLNIL